MDSHFLAGKNIIVAGAGISGLSFTLALRRLWPANLTPPNITIYERDSNVVPAGREGYTISLAGHDETGGLYAARDLGILDDVMNHAVQSFGNKFEFTMWNSSWSELLTQKYEPASGLPASGIRIARKKLRQVLTDVVGRERVIWNTTCVDAERLHNGKMLIKLLGSHLSENESTAECDLLIIADGASSKLRASLRPNDTLQYTGIMQKGGLAIFPNGIPKPVDEKWGLILSSGKGVACFLSPYDETSVSWGLSYRAPTIEEPLRISSIEEAQKVIDECKELGKEFLEPFQSILDATDSKSVSRLAARDKQPFSHDLSLGPAIFIGDSNHAITPFSGYGASLAMKDGWDLATQLCGSQGLEEAVKAYDAISIPRAAKMLKESRQRIDMSHATGFKYSLNRSLLGFGGFVLGIKDALGST